MAEFSEIEGKTITEIIGAEKQSLQIEFKCADGTHYKMCHYQDCCESVEVDDICGDVKDLIGSQIIHAYEATKNDVAEIDSGTWTFYHMATIKGSVMIRWSGVSNGYYSEDVSFERVA